MTGTASSYPVAARRKAALLTVMCVGMFLVQLDVTVVNVALPAIRTGLRTGIAGQQWVVDGYAIVLAGLLLAGGSLGDRFGHKRVVLAGLAVFGAASLLCGLAPGIGALVAGRAIQGLGAALLLPGTLAVITRGYPRSREQARAIGIWAGVSALAVPIGPVLGGTLVSLLGWRAVFLVNLPIVTVAIPATLRLVATDRGARRGVDSAGAGLAALTLASTVFAVISLGRGGTSAVMWVAAGIAVLGLVAFGVREHTAAEPMLPLSLLHSRAFTGANLVAAAMNFVGIGSVFVLTLFLQSVQHHSAVVAGLMLVPMFLPLAALSPVAGRLTARYGPRPPMCVGLALGAVGSAAMTTLDADNGYSGLLPVLVGLGVGMGFLTAAVVAAAVRAVPRDRAGLASGVNNTARQAAGALAIAVFGAVAGSPTDVPLFLDGVHALGVVAAALWVAAIGVTVVTVGDHPSHGIRVALAAKISAWRNPRCTPGD